MNYILLQCSRLLNAISNTIRATSEGEAIQQMANNFSKTVMGIVGPVISLFGIAGVGYCIYLGVLMAKAESNDKRKEVKRRLIGAMVGVAIAIIGATLCFAIDWESFIYMFVK